MCTVTTPTATAPFAAASLTASLISSASRRTLNALFRENPVPRSRRASRCAPTAPGELSYQWYYSNGNKIVDVIPDDPGEFTISGTQTPNLVIDRFRGRLHRGLRVPTTALSPTQKTPSGARRLDRIARQNYRGCYAIDKLDRREPY